MIADPATRLVFARHGESEANLRREFSNSGTKHPLTTAGRRQAARLSAQLGDQGVQRILASPVLRARQTAQILSARLGVGVVVDDRLREFDVGRFEGTRDPSHWEEYGEVMAAWIRDRDVDRRVGDGESHRELRARFVPLVEEVANLPGTTVLVGHGGLYLCMLPTVLSNVAAGWALAHPLEPTDTVVARHVGAVLVCTQWAGLDVHADEARDAPIERAAEHPHR